MYTSVVDDIKYSSCQRESSYNSRHESQPLLEESVNCLRHKHIADPITCARLLCPGLYRESNQGNINSIELGDDLILDEDKHINIS